MPKLFWKGEKRAAIENTIAELGGIWSDDFNSNNVWSTLKSWDIHVEKEQVMGFLERNCKRPDGKARGRFWKGEKRAATAIQAAFGKSLSQKLKMFEHIA